MCVDKTGAIKEEEEKLAESRQLRTAGDDVIEAVIVKGAPSIAMER